MFKFKPETTITWPVFIRVPADGGKVSESECSVSFELLKGANIQEMANTTDDTVARKKLAAQIRGWSGIEDTEGAAIPFTEENLTALLDDPLFAKACAIALMQASMGAPVKK